MDLVSSISTFPALVLTSRALLLYLEPPLRSVFVVEAEIVVAFTICHIDISLLVSR